MTIGTMKIRTYGDPCLRKPCLPVKEVGVSERMLIDAMLKTMYIDKGIGLAASQVGINKQIFVADIGEGPVAVINPKISKKSGHDMMEEGCLCLPGIVVNIQRPHTIDVQFMDMNNKVVKKTIQGLIARVFMHETDHLCGKLIIDYVSEEQLSNLKKQLDELEQKNIK